MRHILMTRYTLPVTFANADANAVRNSDGWLEKRKQLFDTYCLPSVRAQNNENFSWYIAFSHDTPEEYRNYFSDIATPVLARSMPDFQEQIADFHKDEPEDLTIISRLDNDDALAAGFIDSVQSYATAINSSRDTLRIPHVVNFRSGWEVNDATKEIYEKDYPASSFFSFIRGTVKASEIFSIEGGHHAHVHKHFPVTNVSTPDPMWLISIHGDNIGNRISGKLTDHPVQKLQDRFSVQLPQ